MEYRCTYCQGIIPNIRIKCAVCEDYELCLECFSYGAESGKHKAEHDYQTLDDGFKPLFKTDDSDNWQARDELALVQGIEQYGMGNWESVSCKVRNKSSLEVRRHFERHYVNGTIGASTQPKVRKYKITDHTGPVEGPLSPSLTVPLPPLNLSKAEAMELGFLPLRDDFEREWDNEAESVLSGAMVHHADEEVDLAYKLSLVSMYRLRLRERNMRKKVARDYNLVNVYTSSFKKGQPGAKKKSVREYKEFQEKMKKFAQFLSLHEHDRFFQSLQREKQIKSRIKELIKLRRLGITTFEDSEQYEKELAKREKVKEQSKKEKASRHTTPSGEIIPADSPACRRSLTVASPLDNHQTNTPTLRCTPERKVKQIKLEKSLEPVKDVLTETKSQAAIHTHPPHLPANRDAMLSDNEKKLCRRIGMKAASYITLKTCILKDYLKRQHGTPVKLRFPSGFDKTHRRTILNFLEHSGWIQLEN